MNGCAKHAEKIVDRFLERRNTFRQVSRDWPELIRYFPAFKKSQMGKRSFPKKGQEDLYTEERIWIPIINQWLADAMMLKAMPKKKGSKMGVWVVGAG